MKAQWRRRIAAGGWLISLCACDPQLEGAGMDELRSLDEADELDGGDEEPLPEQFEPLPDFGGEGQGLAGEGEQTGEQSSHERQRVEGQSEQTELPEAELPEDWPNTLETAEVPPMTKPLPPPPVIVEFSNRDFSPRGDDQR